MSKLNLKDLQTKGFVIIRKFLTAEQLETLVNDFNAAEKEVNVNYTLLPVSDQAFNVISKNIDDVRRRIEKETDLPYIDRYFNSAYFATQLGINFPWHSDHEDFYMFQNHFNSLNFYMPIVKPNPTQSNLSIVPFDKLYEISPELSERVVDGGAKELIPDEKNNQTFLRDDYYGGDAIPFNFNINDIGITPYLEAGDLLLLRGDILHHTQDNNTDRVAFSARFHYSGDELSMEHLLSMCPHKLTMMLNNPSAYLPILDYFVDSSCPITLISDFNDASSVQFEPHQFVLSKDNQQHWQLHYVDCDSNLHILNINDLDINDLIPIEVVDPVEISNYDLLNIKKKLNPWLKRFQNEYLCENRCPERKYTVGGLLDYMKI